MYSIFPRMWEKKNLLQDMGIAADGAVCIFLRGKKHPLCIYLIYFFEIILGAKVGYHGPLLLTAFLPLKTNGKRRFTARHRVLVYTALEEAN